MDMDRRAFIARAATAVGAAGIAARSDSQEPLGTGGELNAYQFGPTLWVRTGPTPLLAYRSHPTQKYPYIYPFIGPATGLPVTSESSEPWPHHRSILFACDAVNGANYWQAGVDSGQIMSRGASIAEASPEAVAFVDTTDWLNPNGGVDFIDERRFTVTAPSAGLRLLDADIRVWAHGDVHIRQTNHSLFSLRVMPDLAPQWGGNLMDSEGRRGEAETFGARAGWCAFWGVRHGMTEGVALFDHPANPWAPCTWFTRDYGFISPTPMQWLGEQGMDVSEGASWHLRYCVVAFAGDPAEAGLAALYEGWAS